MHDAANNKDSATTVILNARYSMNYCQDIPAKVYYLTS